MSRKSYNCHVSRYLAVLTASIAAMSTAQAQSLDHISFDEYYRQTSDSQTNFLGAGVTFDVAFDPSITIPVNFDPALSAWVTGPSGHRFELDPIFYEFGGPFGFYGTEFFPVSGPKGIRDIYTPGSYSVQILATSFDQSQSELIWSFDFQLDGHRFPVPLQLAPDSYLSLQATDPSQATTISWIPASSELTSIATRSGAFPFSRTTENSFTIPAKAFQYGKNDELFLSRRNTEEKAWGEIVYTTRLTAPIITAVPEPSSVLLFLFGILFLGFKTFHKVSLDERK